MPDTTPPRWIDLAPPEIAAPAEPPARQESDSILDVALGFLALVRRNVLLIGAIVALASIGVVAALRRERPVYRAAAVLRLTDKARSMSAGLGGSATDQIGGSMTDPILSQLQILQSRRVADGIVAREGLRLRSLTRELTWRYFDSVAVRLDASTDTIHASFDATGVRLTAGEQTARAAYGAPVELRGVTIVASSRPPVETANLLVTSAASASDEILRSLRGRARDRTDVVDVTFQANDPVRAQRTVNAAMHVFQDMSAQTSRQQSVRRREFIEGQLQKSDALLAEAQLQHNGFQTREQVFSSQDKFKEQQSDFSGIELRRQELETDRRMYATLLGSLEQAAGSGADADEKLNALVSSPGIAANPVVAQTFAEFLRLRQARDSMVTGPFAASVANPDVKRLDALIVTAHANVLTAVRGQISAADARLAALGELKAKAASELALLPGAQAKENTLLAEVETYRHETDRLREELQKAQIEEAADAGQVEILDPASIPETPIGTGKVPRLFATVLLALFAGAGVAYAIENRNDVIRRREELTGMTPLPNLALVPRFRALPRSQWWRVTRPESGARTRSNAGAGRSLVTVADMHSPGAEAYRTLRTNLLFSAAVHSLHRVVITSAAPKEGKSTTAANLAAACAQQGQRVVLVDCDLRGPSIHAMFSRARAPGLTNTLIGTVVLDDALVATDVPNLTILPAGTSPPNPAELLGSVKMFALLDDLASRFDLVVIDTPPLLAASDAAILARATDGTLMVVRAGQTQRAAVQDAMQQLRTVGARVLGTVLNDPDAEIARFAPYYYQYYYNYHHAGPVAPRGTTT